MRSKARRSAPSELLMAFINRRSAVISFSSMTSDWAELSVIQETFSLGDA